MKKLYKQRHQKKRQERKTMLECNKVAQIIANQVNDLLIVPDVKYKYINKRPVIDKDYSKLNEATRREMVIASANVAVNGNNNKQRARGYTYTGHAINNDNIYVIRSNHDIDIIDLQTDNSNNYSSMSIRYLHNINPIVNQFHQAAQDIGKLWESEQRSCTRATPQGNMKRFGTKRGSGKYNEYRFEMTKHNKNCVNTFHSKLNVAANIISKTHFPKTHADIKRTMTLNNKFIPDDLGGKHGLSCEMVQSQHRLVTEYHVDSDLSRCLSIWSLERGKEACCAEGWFFVLPFLKLQKGTKIYRGVAIELRHGVGIDWDGRSIFHCSTSPFDKSVNVYGTFFGITVV